MNNDIRGDKNPMFGRKHSEESRKKMSEKLKGLKRKTPIRKPLSEETKKKISEAKKGKKVSPEIVEKTASKLRGKKRSLAARQKISKALSNKKRPWHKGELNPNWKGGKTSEALILRSSLEYRLWRTAVFERDNYTCIWGGKEHGNKLNADHIKPFALYPELRFAIDNGRTLCEQCHKTTDTYGRPISKLIDNKI